MWHDLKYDKNVGLPIESHAYVIDVRNRTDTQRKLLQHYVNGFSASIEVDNGILGYSITQSYEFNRNSRLWRKRSTRNPSGHGAFAMHICTLSSYRIVPLPAKVSTADSH